MPIIPTFGLFCNDKFEETPNEIVVNMTKLTKPYFKNFMPAIGIYAKLLTKHGLDNMKDFDKMCQLQASKFGCEDAVEAFWNIEEDYEKIIKRADQALDLRPQETNAISKIGEIAPIGAVLTDGRYCRRNLDMHINCFFFCE